MLIFTLFGSFHFLEPLFLELIIFISIIFCSSEEIAASRVHVCEHEPVCECSKHMCRCMQHTHAPRDPPTKSEDLCVQCVCSVYVHVHAAYVHELRSCTHTAHVHIHACAGCTRAYVHENLPSGGYPGRMQVQSALAYMHVLCVHPRAKLVLAEGKLFRKYKN